jgi:hypothetical protein
MGADSLLSQIVALESDAQRARGSICGRVGYAPSACTYMNRPERAMNVKSAVFRA